MTFAAVVLILVHQLEISDSRPKQEYVSLAHEQEYAWCDCSDLTNYMYNGRFYRFCSRGILETLQGICIFSNSSKSLDFDF